MTPKQAKGLAVNSLPWMSPAREGAPAPQQWPNNGHPVGKSSAVSAGLLGARSGRAACVRGRTGAGRAGGGALSGGPSAG